MISEPPPVIVDRQIALEADSDIAALPSQDELERWISAALAKHEGETRHEVTVRFVEVEESQALNRDYRDRDRPTNVLSFPFESPPGLTLPLLGDLVICHAVVVREAQEQEKSLAAHYAHMVVHGTLHLLGHDHIEDDEAERMEALERIILAGFAIQDPYATDHLLDLGSEEKRPYA